MPVFDLLSPPRDAGSPSLLRPPTPIFPDQITRASKEQRKVLPHDSDSQAVSPSGVVFNFMWPGYLGRLIQLVVSESVRMDAKQGNLPPDLPQIWYGKGGPFCFRARSYGTRSVTRMKAIGADPWDQDLYQVLLNISV